MALSYHCDRDGCDSWQAVDVEGYSCWLHISNHGGDIAHFCTLDCLTHWAAANSEPTQVIPT